MNPSTLSGLEREIWEFIQSEGSPDYKSDSLAFIRLVFFLESRFGLKIQRADLSILTTPDPAAKAAFVHSRGKSR